MSNRPDDYDDYLKWKSQLAGDPKPEDRDPVDTESFDHDPDAPGRPRFTGYTYSAAPPRRTPVEYPPPVSFPGSYTYHVPPSKRALDGRSEPSLGRPELGPPALTDGDESQSAVTKAAKPAQPAAKPSGGKFAGATLLLLGIVSWGAQFAAASAFGIAEYFKWDVPTTGGLVAFIAGIVMWAKCRSWETWKKWIWLPILIIVTLAFILMGFTAQSIAREEAEIRQEEARQAAIGETCQSLAQQIEAKAADIEDRKNAAAAAAARSTVKRPSWMDPSASSAPSWITAGREKADQDEYDELLAEYDESC